MLIGAGADGDHRRSTSRRSSWRCYQAGYYAGTAGVIEIPIWPFMAAVVIGGGTATAVQFLLDRLAQLRMRAAGAERA